MQAEDSSRTGELLLCCHSCCCCSQCPTAQTKTFKSCWLAQRLLRLLRQVDYITGPE